MNVTNYYSYYYTNAVQILENNDLHLHPLITLSLCSLTFIIILYKWLYSTNTKKTILPPSPRKLPIIGNLHQLSTLPHHSLRSLSARYGDLMLLHLGSKPHLVVSSSKGAEEIMKTHDVIFANRPYNKVASLAFYNCRDIAFGKYGEHWRKMKSVCVLNMLNNKKVTSFRKVREEEVGGMVDSIRKCSTVDNNDNMPVNLNDMLGKLMNDMTSRVVFGRKTGEEEEEGLVDIKEVLDDLTSVAGALIAFSIGDFVPWLSWTDHLTGRLRRVSESAKSLYLHIQGIIQEHIDRGVGSNNEAADMVDVLLQVQRNDSDLDAEGVKALLLDMLIGGIETTWTLLEWTMSELLINPRVMKKLQEETRKSVEGKTMIHEEDLKDMKYLKAVIKEALRLHPPGPLLVFREASEDVKVRNYNIAAGTTVMVNAWAIQRDPAYWVDPEEFKPERFLDSTVDVKGQDFELIPFGSGRRGCPGIAFALVEAELVIANLIAMFDWKLLGNVDIDCFMAETFAAAVRRRYTLFAIPTPYSE